MWVRREGWPNLAKVLSALEKKAPWDSKTKGETGEGKRATTIEKKEKKKSTLRVQKTKGPSAKSEGESYVAKGTRWGQAVKGKETGRGVHREFR